MATLVIVRNAWQRNNQPNLLSQSLIHNVPKSQLSSEWLNYTSRSRALKAFQQKIPPPVISHFTLCIDFLKGCTAFVEIFKKGSSWHYGSEPVSSSTKAGAGTPPCEAGWAVSSAPQWAHLPAVRLPALWGWSEHASQHPGEDRGQSRSGSRVSRMWQILDQKSDSWLVQWFIMMSRWWK